jgi:ATP-binding cassette, subfamily B, multidrug efflux pump
VRLVFRYMKRYWLPAIAAPLLMLAEVIMDLMQPTLMARIIDIGIAQLDMTTILRSGVLMVLLSFVGAVGGVGCTVTSSLAASHMAEDLRYAAFSKVLKLSYRNIDTLQTGSIVTRLTNDITQVENTARMTLRIMVRAPLMVIGSLVMSLILSPRLGIILLIAAPLIILAIAIIVRQAYPLYLKVQEKMDRLNTRVFETLAGARLVKAFVRREEEQRRFEIENEGFA